MPSAPLCIGFDGSVPEGHGEPNSHQHEGGPLVLGVEAGQEVVLYLTCKQALG